jgi:TolB protein
MAAADQDAISIAWSVLDISTGANRRYGAFFPTQDMLYMLVYFDQFAQSHRLWSPDSRYLIYAEVTPSNEASINLLDTAQSNTVPFSIASGFIGIWSFK